MGVKFEWGASRWICVHFAMSVNVRLLKHPKNIRSDGFTELPYPPAAGGSSPPRSVFQIRWYSGTGQTQDRPSDVCDAQHRRETRRSQSVGIDVSAPLEVIEQQDVVVRRSFLALRVCSILRRTTLSETDAQSFRHFRLTMDQNLFSGVL